MPWRKKPTAPAGVTRTLALALSIWSDAPSWIISAIPALATGSEYVDLNAFCSLGPPQQLQAPWDAGSLVFPYSLLQYADAQLNSRLFATYCEGYGPPVCTQWNTFSKSLRLGGNQPLFPTMAIPSGTALFEFTLSACDTSDAAFNLFVFDQNGGYLGQLDDLVIPVGQSRQRRNSIAGTAKLASNFDNNRAHDITVQVAMCTELGAYTAPPVPAPPADYVGPSAGSYPDTAALGKALDALLRYASEQNAALARLAALLGPTGPIGAGDSVPISPDSPATVPANAVGAIVTLSQIPASISETFGRPPKLENAGYVTFGNAGGWTEPIELDVSPLLILPLPGGAKTAAVAPRPGITATITWLKTQ